MLNDFMKFNVFRFQFQIKCIYAIIKNEACFNFSCNPIIRISLRALKCNFSSNICNKSLIVPSGDSPLPSYITIPYSSKPSLRQINYLKKLVSYNTNFDDWLPWFLEFLILNLQVNTVDRTSLNNGLNCASNGFRLYLYIVNICFVISYQWILFIRGKPW